MRRPRFLIPLGLFIAVTQAGCLFFPHARTAHKWPTYTGRVVDSHANQPIPEVRVTWLDRSMNTVTDQDGHFHVQGKDVQKHFAPLWDAYRTDDIRFTHPGYVSVTVHINRSYGDDESIDLGEITLAVAR